MSGKRYTEEFKITAVKQLTEGRYPVGEVVQRLGAGLGGSDLAGRMSIDWLDVPYIDLDFRSTYLYMPYFFPKLESIVNEPGQGSSGDMAQHEEELTEAELSERLIEDLDF